MNIEIICIGDELLSGRTQDKNAFWLSSFLNKNGFSLNRINIIGDGEKEITDALKEAFSRASVVFLSGGLGPTKDDFTKNALAKYFEANLVVSKEAKKVAQVNYQRKKLPFIEESNFYHLIPNGFLATDNPKGLAPGLIKVEGSKILMAAPGVPWEFSAMIESVFLPYLSKMFGKEKKNLGKVSIRTYGVPEEFIFYKLAPELWDDLSLFGKVASLPTISGVDIVVSNIDGNKFKNYEKDIKKIVMASPIKPYIWQIGDISLEEFILKLARKKKISLALAESASGGLISNRLTNIPGSSDQFMGSVVCYSNISKIKILGVRQSTLKKYGAVSQEVAREMAVGAQKKFSCDLALSISGIAGPSGGSKKKPVGTVCFGWAFGKNSGAESFVFKGDRMALKSLFTQKSLFILLKKVLEA